jgi:hypothetical protein
MPCDKGNLFFPPTALVRFFHNILLGFFFSNTQANGKTDHTAPEASVLPLLVFVHV